VREEKIADKKKNRLKIEAPPGPSVPAIEGGLSGTGKRFAIVVSRFNAFITERLFQSAYDGLLRSGVEKRDVDLVRVPGAFEIPSAARTLAETGKYDAIICIGCLLRGDTAHYDVIVNECGRGIGQSAQETGVPHAFGVLTCDTLEQAIDRAGLKMGNKGFEAAMAAIEMANLKKAVLSRQSSGVRRQSSVVRRQASGLSPQSSVVRRQSSVVRRQASVVRRQASQGSVQPSGFSRQSSGGVQKPGRGAQRARRDKPDRKKRR
jgi:6,7-dimethyl-8-ribityllumazine synthase